MGRKWPFVSLVFVLALSMLLAACGSDSEEDNDSNTGSGIELGQKDLTLPYVAWAREMPVSYLYAAILEDVGIMWS